MHLLAYGGGDIRIKDTLPIDTKVIHDHGLAHPRILLVAAGLQNNPAYKASFVRYGEEDLHGEVSILDLELEPQSEEVIEELYNACDVIYVGPGDTRHLLNCIETNNFDRWLIRALKEDKLIIGLSAGANCLFKKGIHNQKSVDDHVTCTPIDGLGFVQLCFSPHYNQDSYQESILDYISAKDERGIVCDEGAAFEIKDTMYRCHSFLQGHDVRLLYTEQKELVEEALLVHETYGSILALMD